MPSLTPQVLILRAPGTNCDQETAYAFQLAGAAAEVRHINRVLEAPESLGSYQILCLPGGFSYGDDIAAGQIFAVQLLRRLSDALHAFAARDTLILGICNGFQVLMRSGLLAPLPAPAQQAPTQQAPTQQAPTQPAEPELPAATLAWNESGRFEDRWVHLRVTSARSVFLRNLETLYLPIAHAEGKLVFRDAAARQEFDDRGQLALRYAVPAGVPAGIAAQGVNAGEEFTGEDPARALPFPYNPNGSEANVAGVCDPTGRILGLMPHPERHLFRTHHPHWTRLPDVAEAGRADEGDGLALFRNAVEYFA